MLLASRLPEQREQNPRYQYATETGACIRPNRTSRFPLDIKWDQQALFDRRCQRHEVIVAPLDVAEHERGVAIEHITAGTEVAARPSAYRRLPHTGDRGPVEHRPRPLELGI